jgi:hypothetical protein
MVNCPFDNFGPAHYIAPDEGSKVDASSDPLSVKIFGISPKNVSVK